MIYYELFCCKHSKNKNCHKSESRLMLLYSNFLMITIKYLRLLIGITRWMLSLLIWSKVITLSGFYYTWFRLMSLVWLVSLALNVYLTVFFCITLIFQSNYLGIIKDLITTVSTTEIECNDVNNWGNTNSDTLWITIIFGEDIRINLCQKVDKNGTSLNVVIG